METTDFYAQILSKIKNADIVQLMDCKIPKPECIESGICQQDTHHLYFPRRIYRTREERTFRELSVNQITIPRCEHNEIHATQLPPAKPSRSEMELAILAVKNG